MTDDICGEETSSGDPCKRDAGFGTPNDEGPCMDHREDYQTPRKMTPEVRSSLLGAAEEGAFKDHCAMIAGITEQTLRNWLNWGEEHAKQDIDSELASFYLDFQRARGAGAVQRLEDVSSEFVLERSYGYTKTQEHQLTGEDGGPVQISFSEEVVETPWGDGDEE